MSRSPLEAFRSSGPPSEDLAREAWMLEAAAGGRHLLALSSWVDPVVVLGYGQPASDVDLAWCRQSGVPVLRRITGGTGVVHAGDLSVSLALPRDHAWAGGIHLRYGRFLDSLAAALAVVGAPVARVVASRSGGRRRSPICFEDQLAETLVVAGRKCVGCAQRRAAGAVLVHAAVLLTLDVDLYAGVFRVEPERVRRGLAAALPGGDWSGVAVAVARRMAGALQTQVVWMDRPRLRERRRQRFHDARWAPVAPR